MEIRAGATFFESDEELRDWLQDHHTSAPELKLGLWKKATGRPTITWAQARDQVLCFGWIDGVASPIDEESWAFRVTPRRPGSTWSRVNQGRYAELTAAGRMTAAGVAAYEYARERDLFEKERPGLDDEGEAAIRANPVAHEFWIAQSPSYRRTAEHWVMSAKKPETRARRLTELIDDSAHGLWITPMRRGQRRRPD